MVIQAAMKLLYFYGFQNLVKFTICDNTTWDFTLYYYLQ